MCGGTSEILLANGDVIKRYDKVLIKSLEELTALREAGADISEKMLEFAGKETKVAYIYNSEKMELEIDGEEYFWTEKMISKKIAPLIKRKVGDKVTIISDLDNNKRYAMELDPDNDQSVNERMVRYAGEETTISGITNFGQYFLDIDGKDWYWTDGMFVSEPTEQTEQN